MSRQADDDLDEELRTHLRMAIEERVARGEPRQAAEAAARREFGNVTGVTEATRSARGGLWLERLFQDLAYGWRGLRKTPAFTFVAVITLALAIGANTAVFTVVNSVLLRPLPFREPDKLFLVSYLPGDLPFEVPPSLSDRQWLEYRQRARAFEQVSAYRRAQAALSGAGDAARITGAMVDASFFSVLGVPPVIGRSFTADEETPGRDRVVILGNRLWRERFASDPGVVGRAVTLDGVPRIVVGVMPDGFNFPAASETWTPLGVRLQPGNSFLMSVIGRLKPDATAEQARGELASIMRAAPQDPRDRGRQSVPAILPLQEQLTSKVEASLLIFSGAVGFVLLLACANVANLLLIRAETRRREIALRVALGASRMRIARQLLTESVVLGMLGGAVGVLIALLGVRGLLALAPAGTIPRVEEVQVDGWVLAFTLGVSIATGIVFGIAPALAGTRRDPAAALAHSTRMVSGGRGNARGMLVSLEIALALVLLAGAGLMLKSFSRMRALDKGYDGSAVTTMTVDLPKSGYPDITRLRAFHSGLIERLARVPGVQGVGTVTFRPMSSAGIMGDFAVDGPSAAPERYTVDKTAVSAGYFGTMRMRLLSGRDFAATDDANGQRVVIVSETVARTVWPNGDAVGKRISMSNTPDADSWLTVVGVVNDVVQDGDMKKHATVYMPYLQFSWPFMLDHMTYVVRSDAGARGTAPAMRAALREMDAAIPAQALGTMDDAMRELVAAPLFQTRLLTVFSLIALLLAAIGTYGVLAYDVAERRHEIGLRMALGATPANVMWLVVRRIAMLATWGAAVGIAVALAVTRVLAASLYDVAPHDPATMAAVVLVILLVAFLAGSLPARRAGRTPALVAINEL